MHQDLIYTFRDKVNENNLVYKLFRSRNERNQWSVICSAMDWIEVSIDGIDVENLSRENNNQASIKMITFISCISILWEAIRQLHRVFIDDNSIPFHADCSIFKQSVSDNIYFETIRACFAAHQINLKSIYPDDQDNERWFASWSGGTFSKQDFSVILYSNKPGKESRFFDINFNDIYKFAEKRYSYLSVLIEKIDSIINDYLEEYRNIPIQYGNSVLNDINILLLENKNRFENEYYDYELRKIKRAFETKYQSTDKNNQIMDFYKNSLVIELEEIKEMLQNMKLQNLDTEVDDSIPLKIHYPFSLLSEAISQNTPCAMLSYVVNVLKDFFGKIIDLDDSMSQEEVHVLARAASYKYNCECQ